MGEKSFDVAGLLSLWLGRGLVDLYGPDVDLEPLVVVSTREGFEGDYTLVCFPWLRYDRSGGPVGVASRLGEWMERESGLVRGYNVVKGFLNLTLRDGVWAEALRSVGTDGRWCFSAPGSMRKTLLIEYASPNTNKPLHLGHVRNILLGESVASLFEARGARVIRANLINDRGIHICKSMVAWRRYGGGETPLSSGEKGDHLVGKYYVLFDEHYRREMAELVKGGMNEEDARSQAPILQEAQEMLRLWERGDEETVSLWREMNGWVYAGFEQTYAALGAHFDRFYYESDTYLLGKRLVEDGLNRGLFYRRADGSVWVDLREDGLDEKLLLRADGTSVYMTQDLGTAVERYGEYSFDYMVYVVGNEQDYHFQVLKLLLSKLGYSWSDSIYHLSYGMVFLPDGKMKSREGTVVDADDLLASLRDEAAAVASESGKLEDLDADAADAVYREVGLSALKYYMLRVDPSKSMTYDPRESIDFNGNTGPFLQYTYARASSILRRMAYETPDRVDDSLFEGVAFGQPERVLLRRLYQFSGVLDQAVYSYSPALLANYSYDLAREFNQFYHSCPILREEDMGLRGMRLHLVCCVRAVLGQALRLLGFHPLERM